MNYDEVLKKVENNELSPKDALRDLYAPLSKKPGKRAFFIKMNITVPEEGAAINTFLKILFMIPIPMIFARLGLRLGNRFIPKDVKNEFDFNEISKLLKYSRNTKIEVDAQDAKVSIKIV